MLSDKPVWQQALSAFFDERGASVAGRPTLEDLCFIAGRDPRVWKDEATRNDLRDSILALTQAGPASALLEVGSAAGFLAMMVAPSVGRYEGVDLAEGPLVVARRLGLSNATFTQVDGEGLPFAPASFDAAFCYDVFTNFPSLADGRPLIRDMLTVTRPGGAVLVGNIPDRARQADLAAHVAELSRKLTDQYGPLPQQPVVPSSSVAEPPRQTATFVSRLLAFIGLGQEPVGANAKAAEAAVQPAIVTYDFEKADFVALAKDLGADVSIHDVHPLNPYFGFRFNAVFRKQAE